MIRALSSRAVRPYREQNRWRRALRYGVVAPPIFLFCFLYGFGFALTAPYLMVPFAIPVVLLGLMVIWALPDIGRAPTKTLERLFIIYFGVLLIWPNYIAIAIQGLPWITMLRLIGFPLALVLLVSLSVSSEFRQRLGAVLAGGRPIPLMVLLISLTMLFSVVMGAVVRDFLFGSLQTIFHKHVNWIAVFFVSCWVFSKAGKPTAFLHFLWGVVLVVCAIGVWESLTGGVPWAGRIPSFLKVDDPAVQATLSGNSRAGIGIYRVQGPFSHPLVLAEFLALASPFILHFAVTHPRMWARGAAIVTLLAMAYVALKTQSRLAVVGALASSMLYLLLWSLDRWRRRKESLIAPALIAGFPVGALLLLLGTFFVGRLRRMTWGGGEHKNSSLAREIQMEMGIPKVIQNPLGYGAGQNGEVLGYRMLDGTLTIDNYYLSLVLDFGVHGLVIFLATMVISIWVAATTFLRFKGDDREMSFLHPIAASLLAFIATKAVLSNDYGQPLVFAMLGMIVALAYRARSGAEGAKTA